MHTLCGLEPFPSNRAHHTDADLYKTEKDTMDEGEKKNEEGIILEKEK